MAIESPRIVAGPTVQRSYVPINCVQLVWSTPILGALNGFYDSATGEWLSTFMDAGVSDGHLLAVIDFANYRATLYAWSASSAAWVPVVPVSEYVDPGTGEAWDPLARFYTPLAS